MPSRLRLLLLPAFLPLALLPGAAAQVVPVPAGGESVADTRRALAEAQAQGAAARARAETLEAEAARVTATAERTSRQAAALAARIQQAEAEIAAQEARAAMIERERRVLRARLAERQRPLVRLTAALQRLARRPPALALLRPGSVRETMYMRALLETMLPEVERRTAALRAEIARGKELQQRAARTAADLRASEQQLRAQRQALVALETRQRLESRAASGVADREAERALALAEQARDLGALVSDLSRAGELRQALAALPGPVMRPQRPEDARVVAVASGAPEAPAGLSRYILPVSGRLVAGFGEAVAGQPRSRGIALAPRAGAQVVAPAPGRVAFAGPYRGYGRIVIVEHDGGWTSLVTGLAELDARVGQTLVAGAPLGVAASVRPVVALELRRNGEPVNPLEFVRP